MQCFLTLGLPTFFYPAVYRGVENDTKAFTVASKTNNAGFYKYLSTLAIFMCLELTQNALHCNISKDQTHITL